VPGRNSNFADGSARAFRRGRAFSSGADVHQRQLCKLEEFGQHGCLTAQRRGPPVGSFELICNFVEPGLNAGLVVRQQVTLPNVIAIPGGLPIKVGDDIVIAAMLQEKLRI